MDRLPKHITLKHLNAFVAVAQEASFTHAARRLFQTQSSVTGLIQQLEVALNTTLFNRTSRRVSLTPIGLEFLPRIKQQTDAVLNISTGGISTSTGGVSTSTSTASQYGA